MNIQDQLDLSELRNITDSLDTVACCLVVIDDLNGFYNCEDMFEEAYAALDSFVLNLRVDANNEISDEVAQAGIKCIVLRAEVSDALADIRIELT